MPLSTITIFFPDVSKLKLITFFLSTISFPFQYLPEAKTYLEPSRTFGNGAFSLNIFFAKFTRKHLCWSLILIKLHRSLSYNFTEKKDSNTNVVWWILRDTWDAFFTEHLQATISALRKKYLIKKIVNNPLREGKKWKQLVRKTTTQAN